MRITPFIITTKDINLFWKGAYSSMTLQQVITTLDQFRDEYNTTLDPQIKKLCNFVSNTIDGLNSYLAFFQNTKSAVETSQQFYTESLETISKLIGDNSSGEGDNS